MGKAIRRSWQRNAIGTVLFTGLYALPLLAHSLARMLLQ